MKFLEFPKLLINNFPEIFEFEKSKFELQELENFGIVSPFDIAHFS